jgi:hypothetical protein
VLPFIQNAWATRLLTVGGGVMVIVVALFLGSNLLEGWQNWKPGRDWGADMKQHYTAGKMLQAEGYRPLYEDFHFSREITRDFHEKNFESGHWLDRHNYRYSPLVAWLSSKLLAFPYQLWIPVWCSLSLVAVAGVGFLLRRQWPTSWKASGGFLALFAFPPTLYGLLIYQNAPLSTLILGSALVLSHLRRPVEAGLVLSCLFYKPQLVAWLAFGLLMARSGRSILGLALGGAIWGGLSLLISGWPAHQVWIESLGQIMRGEQGDEMATNIPWRGFFFTVFPDLAFSTVSFLTYGLLVISGLFFFIWIARQPRNESLPMLTLAAAVGWWLIFSPHVKPYDLMLAFPATVVLTATVRRTWASWAWIALWIGVSIAVFARFFGSSWSAPLLTGWWVLLLAFHWSSHLVSPGASSHEPAW